MQNTDYSVMYYAVQLIFFFVLIVAYLLQCIRGVSTLMKARRKYQKILKSQNTTLIQEHLKDINI